MPHPASIDAITSRLEELAVLRYGKTYTAEPSESRRAAMRREVEWAAPALASRDRTIHRAVDSVNDGPRHRIRTAVARGLTYRDGPVLLPAPAFADLMAHTERDAEVAR
jgi:hypothetical protein